MKRYIVFIAFLMACLCAYSDHSVMSNNPVAENQSTRSSDEDLPTVWLEDVDPLPDPYYHIQAIRGYVGEEIIIRATVRELEPTYEENVLVEFYVNGEHDIFEDCLASDGYPLECRYIFIKQGSQEIKIKLTNLRNGDVYELVYIVSVM